MPAPRKLELSQRMLVLCAGLLLSLLYLPSLSSPFLFDDTYVIVNNYYLRTYDGLLHLLTRAGWTPELTFGKYYRPLTMASYWVTYQLAGLQPWAYRLGNLVVHCVNALLLFTLFVRLLAPRRPYR